MEISNRELFFKYKNKEYFNDKIIYELLIFSNNFKDFTELIINFDNNIKNYNLFKELIDKIEKGIPYQYALGYAFFLDMKLKISNDTLIPRSETEELCLITKDFINKYNLNHSNIVDVCSGSGCISLYFKKEFNNSNVIGIDISSKALEISRFNSNNLLLNVNYLEGNIIDPLIENNIKVDILISNPPYVENKDDIEEIVIKNEPINAIYSEDGTYFYEYIFKNYNKILNNKFLMSFEINYDQEEKLTKLINKYFDKNINYLFKKDSYNLTRFLFITRGYDIWNF